MAFIHLRTHTEFSVVDGIARIDDLAQAAAADGQAALAITDLSNLYGAVKFYQVAQQHEIKPIIGCEVYVAPEGRFDRSSRKQSPPFHLILLAKDKTGYRNLIHLTTKAHLEGFYYKPRVDKELLRQYNQGLIATSACGSGEIARLVEAKQMVAAREAIRWYQDTYGSQGFYLELQRHAAMPEFEEFYAKYPGTQVFVDNLNNVLKARPQIVQYPRISTALGQALIAALQGDMTAQAALDQAAEQADGFLSIPA